MQDKAIIEIGKLKGDKKAEPYQNFVENMFPGKNYDIIVAVFRLAKNKGNYTCEFDKIDIDAVSKKNYMQYAYRKKKGSGGNFTFTRKISETKTLSSTLLKQVKYAKGKFSNHPNIVIWDALQVWIEDNEQFFLNKVTLAVSKYNPKKDAVGFTIVFVIDGEKKYLEDIALIKDILLWAGNEGKSFKYDLISESKDKICSICNQIKPLVHGFASPFSFATVDKTGFVSGFFKQKNNWKNYPICSDCALDFELGQKHVVQYLSKNFYRKSYYIIPKLVVGSNPELLDEALEVLEEVNYKESGKKTIKRNEEYLMQEIANKEGDKNRYVLNLLFYEENPTTKAIKIKLFLEEILPSRFRTLFVTVPNKINENRIFIDAITIKKEKQDLQFSFGIVKSFFGDSFFDIIQKIFMGIRISEKALFANFIHLIRINYNKSQTSDGFVEPTKWTVLKAVMLLNYLQNLEIITKNKTLKNMEEQKNQDVSAIDDSKKEPVFNKEVFDKFLKENEDFLNTKVKIGVFSVGIYIRFLLNLQYANMNKSMPFEKKLRGYNLNAELLKKLYLEAKHKISQFIKTGGFYTYKNLREEVINEYFFKNEHKLLELTDDQLSFYFVAGLEFATQFKNENSNEDEDE